MSRTPTPVGSEAEVQPEAITELEQSLPIPLLTTQTAQLYVVEQPSVVVGAAASSLDLLAIAASTAAEEEQPSMAPEERDVAAAVETTFPELTYVTEKPSVDIPSVSASFPMIVKEEQHSTSIYDTPLLKESTEGEGHKGHHVEVGEHSDVQNDLPAEFDEYHQQPDNVAAELRDRSAQDYEVFDDESQRALHPPLGDVSAEVDRAHRNPSWGTQADTESSPQMHSAVDTYPARRTNDVENLSMAIDTGGTIPSQLTVDDGGKSEVGIAETEFTPTHSNTTVAYGDSTGTVFVTLMVMPMRFRSLIHLPVHTCKQSKIVPGCENEDSSWVLVGKDIFEGLGRHMCVHPQSFQVYRSSERIRFTSTLFLPNNSNESGAPEDPSGSSTEPLWLTVVFPDGIGDEGKPLTPIPPHLEQLHDGDVLLKCIQVHREKPPLVPATLVAGRRLGLTFDDVIRHAYEQERLVTGDTSTTVPVAIVRDPAAPPKAFLGGYRVKKDHSRVFLHASTQLFMKDLNYSPFRQKDVPISQLRSRQTQTYGTSRSCQTQRECCVQSPRHDLELDNSHDYRVTARPYFSSLELQELKIEKSIRIQCMYRQWKARQIRHGLEEADADKQHRAETRQHTEEAIIRARENREHLRRADPKTAKDFNRLKEEVYQWRAAEAARVLADTHLTPEQRRIALVALTKEELKLLSNLESRRRTMSLQKRDRSFINMLNQTAADKTWGTVTVSTPETIRASELRDLYHSLVDYSMPPAERLDVLLHVKWTVKEFPHVELSQELCQLIDREADLLNRGRKEASLSGLRTRIENHFKHFIEDPEFNPGMEEGNPSALTRAKVSTLRERERAASLRGVSTNGRPKTSSSGRSRPAAPGMTTTR